MPRSSSAWAGLAVLTFLANTGCGGGSKSTPINEDLFCEQKATAECQVTTKCGTVMMTPCVTERKTACLAVGAAAQASGTRKFQAGNVPACVNKTNAVYAKALSSQATPTDLADMDDVCAYVYQGASTTTCTVKYDCAGNQDLRQEELRRQGHQEQGAAVRQPGRGLRDGLVLRRRCGQRQPDLPGQGRPGRSLQRHRPLSRDPALRRRDRHLFGALHCRPILRIQQRLRRGRPLLRSVHRLQVRSRPQLLGRRRGLQRLRRRPHPDAGLQRDGHDGCRHRKHRRGH